MKDHATLKIDSAFPGLQADKLSKMLTEGWKIVDKTTTGSNNRYIFYVLAKPYEDQNTSN